MENKKLVNKEYIDCRDIYNEEIQSGIKTLKRFREIWAQPSHSSSRMNKELFQYADADFYFYRFAVSRQESNTKSLLSDILCRLMERYGYSFKTPNSRINAPFEFIICNNGKRIGYRFTDFYGSENVNEILDNYKVDEAYILRTLNPGRADEEINSENERYKSKGIRLKAIYIKDFFDTHFAEEEYGVFVECIEQYLKEAREIVGYTTVKFLSPMNLATQRMYEKKILSDFDYKDYRYQIIDRNNKKIEKYLYLADEAFNKTDVEDMYKNYVQRGICSSMLGINEYAESFMTSEWLYHSLKEKKNFDYTSVISGYLKSIEQLLYHIVMLNVDNGCKISMSNATEVMTEAKNAEIDAYIRKKDKWEKVSINKRCYIDLKQDQVKYMDSSMGTFEYFLKYNPHIFYNHLLAEKISGIVRCFRTECRNGYFHTHNLNDWDTVEKTRNNAIYLYFILLGECIIPKDKECKLGISRSDDFDELCKKIRKFSRFNLKFIFEYSDGRKRNLIYDFQNNTIEYTDDGNEHYQSLLFYEVDDFEGAYEKLDEGIREEQKVYLTRETLPSRIIGVYRDNRKEEIFTEFSR